MVIEFKLGFDRNSFELVDLQTRKPPNAFFPDKSILTYVHCCVFVCRFKDFFRSNNERYQCLIRWSGKSNSIL
jgi:hypothetical protein